MQIIPYSQIDFIDILGKNKNKILFEIILKKDIDNQIPLKKEYEKAVSEGDNRENISYLK